MTVKKIREEIARRDISRVKYGLLALTAAGAIAYGGHMHLHRAEAKGHSEAALTALQEVQMDTIEVQRLKESNDKLREENSQLKAEIAELKKKTDKGEGAPIDVKVTAYTLSEESCAKLPEHPAYGKTATGEDLAGDTLWSARTIAVDPDVIPLGSKVRLTFEDPDMKQYDGIYTALDTGNAIKGNRIDLFAGDGEETLAREIGIRDAVAVIVY